MNQDRKARIKELRQRLANLTEPERQAFISRGMVATVEGRAMSLHNTLLLYLQGNGTPPSVVGGYKQWQQAGRQVKKGEHGMMIWFPVGQKDGNGDITEPENYFTGTVFDISQTEPIEIK